MTISKQFTAWRPARILVPIDLSSISDQALNFAVALARHFDAHVYLTHVIVATDQISFGERMDANPERREDAERKIARILNSRQLHGVRHTVLLEEGFLWQTLEMVIRKHDIDLAVVGTHGRKAAEGEFLGSWAELIFRHAACPVVTVGPGSRGSSSQEVKIANILLATDFGRASEHAALYACSLTLEFGSCLTLLNVVQGGSSDYSKEGWAVLQETTRVRLLESLPPEVENLCKPEYLVQRGDSAQEILNVARSKKADLIVMGARFGNSLAPHLPEPSAFTVVAGSPCPVLTVKAY